MAIAKTSPPLKMTVCEYRYAAIRHFNTCKILWRYVSLPQISNLKNINENEILKNIFYLSGYVAECAIKYRYLTDCHTLNDTDEENEILWKSRGIQWKRHFSFALPLGSTTSKDKDWSEKVIQDLCSSSSFRTIPDYLKILGQVSPMPTLLRGDESPHDMQASWEPSTRYYYEANGLILNKPDIEAYFQATQTLLRNLSII